MPQLYVFYQFTPDGNTGRYYMPKKAAQDWYTANQALLKAMQADSGNYTQLESGTYNIFTEYVDISLKAVDGNGMTITYIAIDDGQSILFYYVDSVTPRPNGYRCYTTLDKWATYINIAKISNVNFTRSNLHVGNNYEYLYLTEETPSHTGAALSYIPVYNGINENSIRREDLRVFVALKFLNYKALSVETEEINMFFIDPMQIAKKNGRETPNAKDIYDTINVAFAIYAVQAQGGLGNTAEAKAEVLHVYLMPGGSAYGVTGIIDGVTIYNGEKTTVELEQVPSQVSISRIPIVNTMEGYTPVQTYAEYVKINTMGFPLYFGTKYNYLKLPQFVLGYEVSIRYQINRDSINLIVRHGNEERDITSSIEIIGVANTATLTASQNLARWLGIAAQAAGGIAQIIMGGPGMVTGALHLGGVAVNTFATLLNQNGGTIIGGGDGLVTYKDIIENGTGDIFFYAVGYKDPSGNNDAYRLAGYNAMYRVLRTGAICNIRYLWPHNEDIFAFLSTRKFLYEAQATAAVKPLPVIACTATVDNVPYDAAQVITDRLSEGVEIQFYE